MSGPENPVPESATITDREVLDTVLARVVRIEIRLSKLLVFLGLNYDGRTKAEMAKAATALPPLLSTDQPG